MFDDNKCPLCNQEYPPKTGMEAMMRIEAEETKERHRMIWANLPEETRQRYLKELDEGIKAGKEAIMKLAADIAIPKILIPAGDEQK